MESLTHEHDAGNYVWMDDPSGQTITQVGKCDTCGEDITRRVHVVGKPIFAEWEVLP